MAFKALLGAVAGGKYLLGPNLVEHQSMGPDPLATSTFTQGPEPPNPLFPIAGPSIGLQAQGYLCPHSS